VDLADLIIVAVFDADRPAVLYKNAVNEAAGSDIEFSIFLSGMQEGDRGAAPLLTPIVSGPGSHRAELSRCSRIVRQARFLEGGIQAKFSSLIPCGSVTDNGPQHCAAHCGRCRCSLAGGSAAACRRTTIDRSHDGVLPAGIVPDLATSIDMALIELPPQAPCPVRACARVRRVVSGALSCKARDEARVRGSLHTRRDVNQGIVILWRPQGGVLPLRSGSLDNRLATTQPAEPAPTTMTSKAFMTTSIQTITIKVSISTTGSRHAVGLTGAESDAGDMQSAVAEDEWVVSW